MSEYRLIIFDLDGTLLDTSKGIFNSVRYAEEKMKLQPISEENLRKFVGPPPAEMYKKLYGLSEEGGMRAASLHREYGRTKAIYEATLYAGVTETLSYLAKQEYRLAVATLKRQDIAELVLSIHGIDKFFAHIVGMNQAESETKAGLIKRVCSMERVAPKETLMVGDSQYDYDGAVGAGTDFLGVTYGFGFTRKESGMRCINTFSKLAEML